MVECEAIYLLMHCSCCLVLCFVCGFSHFTVCYADRPCQFKPNFVNCRHIAGSLCEARMFPFVYFQHLRSTDVVLKTQLEFKASRKKLGAGVAQPGCCLCL